MYSVPEMADGSNTTVISVVRVYASTPLILTTQYGGVSQLRRSVSLALVVVSREGAKCVDPLPPPAIVQSVLLDPLLSTQSTPAPVKLTVVLAVTPLPSFCIVL